MFNYTMTRVLVYLANLTPKMGFTAHELHLQGANATKHP